MNVIHHCQAGDTKGAINPAERVQHLFHSRVS